MASVEIKPNPSQEPELNLLLAPDTFEPLWKSLFRGLDEFFFPKKLPPLKLESKPEPVKDIWGFYNYKKNGALGSSAAHVVLLALIIGGTLWIRHLVPKVEAKASTTTELIDPGDFMPLKAAKTQAGGGGGGGDHDVLQASKGRLPKFSLQQITPPTAVIRNDNPKLAVEPTVIVPPEIKVAMNNMPVIGDPKSSAVIPSNGTGSLSGMGTGSGGGVGSGTGAGVGPGIGGGMGGGYFRPGRGVTAPRVIYQTDPEFSEEARKAKYQGTCVLGLIVDTNGRPTQIRVINALGMGLDEKAIESVKNWKFEPGQKDGHPVPVEIAVEVDFHLY
jgi:periplasmic protein TonB